MKIVLLNTGKTTEKELSSAIEDYTSRISRYISFEVKNVPDIKNTRNMSAEEQKNKEGKLLLQETGGEDYIVLLDERGKEFKTIDFSDFLRKRLMISKKELFLSQVVPGVFLMKFIKGQISCFPSHR